MIVWTCDREGQTPREQAVQVRGRNDNVVYRPDPVWWDQVTIDRSHVPRGLRWVRAKRKPRERPGIVLPFVSRHEPTNSDAID